MVTRDDRSESTPEQQILSQARAGEAKAFCLLVEPLQARLLRQAVALSGDPSAAEDLVSETLIEAWKSLSRYNESCRLSTWLCSILIHRYQKSIRHARARPVSFASLPRFEAQKFHEQQPEIASSDLSPNEAAVQREGFNQVRQCVNALPARHRQMVWLRFFEDASLRDMAAVSGCSIGTVKSRLHHALEKLGRMKMNLPDIRRD